MGKFDALATMFMYLLSNGVYIILIIVALIGCNYVQRAIHSVHLS